MKKFWPILGGLVLLLAALHLLPGIPKAIPALYAGCMVLFVAVVAGWKAIAAMQSCPMNTPWRHAWKRISAAALVWLLGQALETVEIALGVARYGTISDAYWMLSYIAVWTAFFPRFLDAFRKDRKSAALILAVGLAAYALLWLIFLEPHLQDPARPDLLKLLDVAYPTADLLTIWLIYNVFHTAAASDRPVIARILLAFLCLSISDIVGSYGDALPLIVYHLANIPYLLFYCLIILAAEKSAAAHRDTA